MKRLLLPAAAGVLFAAFLAVATELVFGAGIRAEARVRLDASLVSLADGIARLPEGASSHAFVREAAVANQARVTWIAPDGRVLADSDVDPERIAAVENHAARPEVARAFRVGEGTDGRLSATLREEFVYAARRVDAPGPARGSVLRLALPEKALSRTAAGFRGVAALFGLGGGLVLVAVVLAMRVRRERDVARLVETVDVALAGVTLPAGPDLEDLERVRALLGDIQRRTESALRGDERLRALAQTVFEELPEGLIVVDSRLRILDANPAARAMFDSGTLSPGTPLLDLVRSTGILAAFESALADGRPVSTTVTVFGEARGDRFLELSVRSLPGEHLPEVPAAVALIRDATQREKTEAMRKQFVADVSHELRTPVAAIRAASETLGQETEGLTADGQHFLSIILRQARHMEELVSDLMDLSQIEIGAVTLTIERHRAKELLEDVAHDLSAASEARQVKVVVEAPEDATVDGDRRRLEQILRNLLDNAIKFSPVGGTVTASAERCGAATRVRVADEGRGIPKGETDKIFQRFYRVDPSRAKTVPGTGLGLAIVKHLLILHAGSIAVSSEVGAGSVFTVKLPDKLKAE